MKHPKLWDGISSILVLFGFGLYGSSCWYGVWALVYAALGCVVLGTLIAVFTQRCPFCRRYLGMMFFSGKKTYCPHCGSDVHADRNVSQHRHFPLCWMHRTCESGDTMKLGLCQMPVTASKTENDTVMRRYVRDAAAAGCDLVVLPEMWCCPYSNAAFAEYAEPQGGETWCLLRDTAREYDIWLVAGSVPERDGDAIYNTCYVFDPQGTQQAKHRKVHLFDIDVAGGQRFFESDTLSPGQQYTLVDTPFGKLGVAICFDVRFAELFRILALEGAQLIVVPAAFNMTTGPAHWELLFRARALDNQCFVAGCAPARDETAGYVSYAHSLVCDPWGRVQAQAEAEPELLICDIDLSETDAVRAQLPVLRARRTDLYQLKYEKDS